MGCYVVVNIWWWLCGELGVFFCYCDYGNFVMIGWYSVVVDLGMLFGLLCFLGYVVWLFWLFVYVWFFIGFCNCFVVLLDWVWVYWIYDCYVCVVI